MNHPPLAQEVIRNVCAYMRASTLVAMALTCRDFLEPALDALWYDVAFWKPFISCLQSTKELWTITTRPLEGNPRITVDVLYPRRVITLEDLDRYLTYYAPRIRDLHLGLHQTTVLSIEAWKALHVATDGKRGVLSPLLKTFYWSSPEDIAFTMGEDAARQISPYMSLFLSDSITSLSFDVPQQLPLHAKSLEEAIKRLPRLRCLNIYDESERSEPEGRASIKEFITSIPLQYLEKLTVSFVTTSMVRHLALLPHLKALCIQGENETIIDLEMTAGSDLICGSFSSLNSLRIHRTTASKFRNLLCYIPPTNVITEIKCVTDETASTSEIQETIDTMPFHCNPLTLETLWFNDFRYSRSTDEPMELDLTQEVQKVAELESPEVRQSGVRGPRSVRPRVRLSGACGPPAVDFGDMQSEAAGGRNRFPGTRPPPRSH
ncbi:hypothetical protein D9611_005276 [Ephemerocybe angulata]|uniref:F-box domain-containing protein n=1 Tax=Ephemerocybe angulata TaxID=980116 RepID=A0A8H5FD54_9AGAR|nr:hypothetical protein D9611_005276 [Tulosesus angulatus]